jgi:RNA polymerase sigma factor (sigma-70 family)
MSVPATRELDVSFEQLYREHRTAVRSLALSLVHDPAEAEDIAQSTFLNAYKSLLRGGQPQQPRAWLLAIAKNLARQHLHERTRAQRVPLDPDSVEAPAPSSGPTAAEIRSALERLGPKQRDVLILREVQGLSYAELKERLDLEPAALQVLLFRARAALQEVLEGYESPITCGRVEELVRRQLGGEALRVEKRELRAHLRSCPACSTSARSLRARASRLSRLGALPLPWGLLQRLSSLLAEGSESHRLALKIALGLGATMIAGGAAVGTGLISSSTSRPPASAHAASPAARLLVARQDRPGARLQAGAVTKGARRAAEKPPFRARRTETNLTPPIGADPASTRQSNRPSSLLAVWLSDPPSLFQPEAPPPASVASPATDLTTPAPPAESTASASSSESGDQAAPGTSSTQPASVSTLPVPASTVSAPSSTVPAPSSAVSVPASTVPAPAAGSQVVKSSPGRSEGPGRKPAGSSEPVANGHGQNAPSSSKASGPTANGRGQDPPGNGKASDPGANGRGQDRPTSGKAADPAANAKAPDPAVPPASEPLAPVPTETAAESLAPVPTETAAEPPAPPPTTTTADVVSTSSAQPSQPQPSQP